MEKTLHSKERKELAICGCGFVFLAAVILVPLHLNWEDLVGSGGLSVLIYLAACLGFLGVGLISLAMLKEIPAWLNRLFCELPDGRIKLSGYGLCLMIVWLIGLCIVTEFSPW